jgi:hypothetical protein
VTLIVVLLSYVLEMIVQLLVHVMRHEMYTFQYVKMLVVNWQTQPEYLIMPIVQLQLQQVPIQMVQIIVTIGMEVLYLTKDHVNKKTPTF